MPSLYSAGFEYRASCILGNSTNWAICLAFKQGFLISCLHTTLHSLLRKYYFLEIIYSLSWPWICYAAKADPLPPLLSTIITDVCHPNQINFKICFDISHFLSTPEHIFLIAIHNFSTMDSTKETKRWGGQQGKERTGRDTCLLGDNNLKGSHKSKDTLSRKQLLSR